MQRQEFTMMPDEFFRPLSPGEEASFRQWARNHWRPGDGVNPLWHPVVRDEIRKMTAERSAVLTV